MHRTQPAPLEVAVSCVKLHSAIEDPRPLKALSEKVDRESNIASPHSADSSGAQEAKPDAFSTKPKVSLAASVLRFRPG